MKCWPWAHHWHYKAVTINYNGCANGETRTMSEYTCCWCGNVKLFYPRERDYLYGG